MNSTYTLPSQSARDHAWVAVGARLLALGVCVAVVLRVALVVAG